MIRYLTAALMISGALACAPQTLADDAATPQEVIAKVREAAAYLQKHGKEGLKAFDSADSPFVFKDTYVFVYDCAAGLADVAHPAAETKPGKIATDKDAIGKLIGPEMCKLAQRPNGGWIEYMWWKPVKVAGQQQLAYTKEISRKVTYMLGVKGQPYQVGAGIYNDTATVKELDALLAE